MSAIPREWTGLQSFPDTTQSSLASLLERLREANLEEVTILLLGKNGVGKSSTINSIFGERVCPSGAFSPDTSHPIQISRRSSNFTINIIDTPGLVDFGAVNEQSLLRIQEFCKNKTIHVMLYVDRLDAYRVDNLDRQIMNEISSIFTPNIWKIGAFVLTHAQLTPGDGTPFADFVDHRSSSLQSSVQQQGLLRRRDSKPPVLLVENSSRCAKNSTEEKVLPNGDVWLVKLVEGIVNISTSGAAPVIITQQLIDGPDVNNRGKLFIPLLILFQFFFIVRPLRKAIKEDSRMEWDARADWEISASNYKRDGFQNTSLRRQEELRKRNSRQKPK